MGPPSGQRLAANQAHTAHDKSGRVCLPAVLPQRRARGSERGRLCARRQYRLLDGSDRALYNYCIGCKRATSFA